MTTPTLSADEIDALFGVETDKGTRSRAPAPDLTGASTVGMSDDELDMICAATAAPPFEGIARITLAAFAADGVRLRTTTVGDRLVALLITSVSPETTVYGGVEPAAIVRDLPPDVLLHRAHLSAGRADHTCWVFLVGGGRLVRTWMRTPLGNADEHFYGVKRSGEVKPLARKDYRALQTRVKT